jgi:hypothetical protein
MRWSDGDRVEDYCPEWESLPATFKQNSQLSHSAFATNFLPVVFSVRGKKLLFYSYYIYSHKENFHTAWEWSHITDSTNLLTYLLIWKADCHSARQKISCFLMEHEGSSPCSQKPTTGPHPEPLNPVCPIKPYHVLFSMLRSYQRISPGLRHFKTFRNNKKFLWWGVVGPMPNHQARGPPLVGCPRLLIQYIRSYPPYLEDFPPSATWGCAMPWWQGTHLTWSTNLHRRKIKFITELAVIHQKRLNLLWYKT